MADAPAHLGHLAPMLTGGSSARVALAEATGLGQVDLRLRAGDDRVLADVALLLGADLPTKPNHFAADDGIEALWLGPDQWLLVGPAAACARLAVELERALAGRHAAVTDVSDARTALELSGPGSEAVLAKGCAIDLHRRAFAPGRVAQTLLARIPVTLQRRDTGTWRILVRPSYAEHLAAWLLDAMLDER